MDHGGAGQYSRFQIDAVTALLTHSVLGNPHTTGGISEVTAYRVQKAREDVLKFFNTTEAEYTVVFTVRRRKCRVIEKTWCFHRMGCCLTQSGATDSAKKVAELFPWVAGSSRLCYTVSNHTSCVGIRNAAFNQGVEVSCVDHDLTGLRLPPDSSSSPCQHDLPFTAPPKIIASERSETSTAIKDAHNLFVLSAECNFSGVKTDLRVVDVLQNGTTVSARPSDVSTPFLPRLSVIFTVFMVLMPAVVPEMWRKGREMARVAGLRQTRNFVPTRPRLRSPGLRDDIFL